MKCIKINKDGMFEKDVILEARPTIPQEVEVLLEDGTTEVQTVQVDDPMYITETPIGFYHPKWDGEKWTEGKVFTKEELQLQLELRIEQIKKECESKILGGFESDCFGETKVFSSSMNNQATIQGLVLTAIMNMSGFTDEVLEHKAIDEIDCYPWKNEQIIQLGVDLKSHITACKKEAEEKINNLITQ